MNNVLILGANGSIANHVIDLLLDKTDHVLTLYLRNANHLGKLDSNRVHIIEGDVLNPEKLEAAMTGQDIVYANLAGSLEQMANRVVDAMDVRGIKRLIWISSMGIYDEVPGEKYGAILDPYRKSANIIESSNLDYTILRPGWFTNSNVIDYEMTQKGEPFKGHEVSRKSVADLIVKLIQSPETEVRCSLGVNKPAKH